MNNKHNNTIGSNDSFFSRLKVTGYFLLTALVASLLLAACTSGYSDSSGSSGDGGGGNGCQAGYCNSNGYCCLPGYVGCNNQCYSTSGAACGASSSCCSVKTVC